MRDKPYGEPYSALRYLLIRAMPMYDETGRIVRWAGTGTDVYDRDVADEASLRDLGMIAQSVPHLEQGVQLRLSLNFEHHLWHQTTHAYRAVLVRANPTFDNVGNGRSWTGTLTDVDDERRAYDRDHLTTEAFRCIPKSPIQS